MLRRWLWGILVGGILATGAVPARGQGYYGNAANNYLGAGRYFGAPGMYGTSWGYPSYGSVATYTAFASPFGPGYGYGYGPYGYLPPAYGVRLWRPGFAAPGYVYGASLYSTYLAPYEPGAYANPAPIGIYAPGFGPSPYYPYPW